MDPYKNSPVAIYNGCYYELPASPEDYMKIVEIESLSYKEEPCKVFPVSLESAAYCQVGQHIIIMARGLLIVYDLSNMRYQVLNKEKPEINTAGCSMIVE